MEVSDDIFIMKMVQQLMSCKYFYESTVSGCYDDLVSHFNMVPESSKEVIIQKFDTVWKILNDRRK